MQRLVIRADASPQMGSGHVMRTLAIAQAWRDAGGEVAYHSAQLPDALARRLADESIGRTDRDDDADWVVVDGYHFDPGLQRQLVDRGQRVLWVDDDGHADRYAAHLVLNVNPHARVAMYAHRDERTELLLGLRYALLRREFAACEPAPRRGACRALLVTLGGGDHAPVYGRIAAAIDSLDADVEVRVIGGDRPPSNKVTHYPTTGDMPAMMRWADAAVTAAGGTAWELAYMGVPMVAIVVADNQRPNAEALRAHRLIDEPLDADATADQIAAALGSLVGDSATRQRRSDAGMQLIDGRGAGRIVRAMTAEPLALRHADESDCRWLWELANDQGVRAASFGREPIAFDAHRAWYAERLADAHTVIYIAHTSGGSPVGYARFAMNDTTRTATISVALVESARGRGLAGRLIRRGVQRLALAHNVGQIEAIVHPDNAASIAAFGAEGFAPAGTVEHVGRRANRYTLALEATT